jgi:endonuclease/exonuclease/phosphatase family metal-dependent hydrolase
VPFLVLATSPPAAVASGRGPFRLLDWNLHSAVDAQGQVDLAGVRDLIRSQDPDVVALQEVGRGWPIAGATDEAEWLSRALAMPYVWAPAADDQFGNVILSRFPILDVRVQPLPYGEGPQHRSALRAVVEVASDLDVPVICVHLQNGDKPATREQQIRAVLQLAGADPRTIVAGDFNMQPTETNVALLEDAGYRSAQDVAGDPDGSTARDAAFPGDRVDWIWGASDVAFSSFETPTSEVSDHLPLSVSVDAG